MLSHHLHTALAHESVRTYVSSKPRRVAGAAKASRARSARMPRAVPPRPAHGAHT